MNTKDAVKELMKDRIIARFAEEEKRFVKNLVALGTSKEDAKLYGSAYAAGMNMGMMVFSEITNGK